MAYPSQKMCFFLILAVATISAASASTPQTFTIAGLYETKSEVARTASMIDLDQKEIKKLLDQDLDNDDADWLHKAREIYEKGMHSGPYATLTLNEPLQRDFEMPKSAIVSEKYANSISVDNTKHAVYRFNVVGGNDNYDKSIHGTHETTDPKYAFKTGNTQFSVMYPEGSTCNVDGNMEECFAGPNGGMIVQGYGAIDYTYDPRQDNKFTSSLKKYSEDEGLRMNYCEHHNGCAYPEYQHFYNYYGILDYGHHWINAAFYKQTTVYSTKVKLAHGNEDFSLLSNKARNEAITTATVAMNIFTQINRLMVEIGIDGCNKNAKDFSSYGDSSAMDSVVAAWDMAAATYAGSALIKSTWLKSEDVGMMTSSVQQLDADNEYGTLYFDMVQSLANEFGVLERVGIGYRSVVNWKVFEEFRKGRVGLSQGDCEGEARHSYNTIVHLMRVPWVQGVLRAAYLLSSTTSSKGAIIEEERGRGAAYLAALLPDLHNCSPSAAKTIYDELKITDAADLSRRPDYEKVRNTLEHQFECLRITCDDVGGYINKQTGSYFEATRPCGGYGNEISQRRESVTYTNAAAYNSSGSESSSGINFFPATFFVAIVACAVSLAVLVVAINAHARRTGGMPIRISGRHIFSLVSSQADYWMSGSSRSSASGSSTRRYDNSSDRSMSLGSSLGSGMTSSSRSNDSNSNIDYSASSMQEVQLQSMSSPLPPAERYFQIASDDNNNVNDSLL